MKLENVQSGSTTPEAIAEITVALKKCETFEDLELIWKMLSERQRRAVIPVIKAEKLRIHEAMKEQSLLYGLTMGIGMGETFYERHGRLKKSLFEAVNEWQSARLSKGVVDEDSLSELRAVVDDWANESPRRAALYRLDRDIRWRTMKGVSHVGAEDVFQLRLAIVECIGLVLNTTDGNALDAFADAFAKAKELIDKRQRGLAQHAPKKAVLAEAWEHVKKSNFYGYRLSASARACADHYRDGPVTYYGFLAHFRAQAKVEGLDYLFKPGRKPKVAKKPAKRAA